MNPISQIFSQFGTHQTSGTQIILSLLVAFVLGQFSAWGYMWSHRGISYSRTFTQALVLISLIGALSMSLVRMNLIAAFGLLGGLAIIRFRTVVRDTRDTVYILLCLLCGMASGFGFFDVAILGALSANLVALYLHKTEFGAWHTRDGFLRFQVASEEFEKGTVGDVLREFCSRISLVTLDEVPSLSGDLPTQMQCAYNIRLKDPDEAPGLMSRLSDDLGAAGVHLLAHRENEEVA